MLYLSKCSESPLLCIHDDQDCFLHFYKTYFVKKTKNISKLKFLRKIYCDWQYDKKLF